MSWNGLELQLSVSRLFEVNKAQAQIHTNNQTYQQIASEEVHKEEEKKRNTVIKNEQKDTVSIKYKEERDQPNPDKREPKKGKKLITQSNTQSTNAKHLYKGLEIDIRG